MMKMKPENESENDQFCKIEGKACKVQFFKNEIRNEKQKWVENGLKMATMNDPSNSQTVK